jgi:hypothetical protein
MTGGSPATVIPDKRSESDAPIGKPAQDLYRVIKRPGAASI